MEKIKVIIKRPDEKVGHVTYISNTLENFQKSVGGRIEAVPIGVRGAMIICDEDGKSKPYETNFRMGMYLPDRVVGTVVICGTDGEEFSDVPITLKEWKLILEMWGNKC